MKPRPSIAMALVLATWVAAAGACRAAVAQGAVHVEPDTRHLWSGEVVEYAVRVTAPVESRGLSLGWEFESGGAVLARGESALDVTNGESAPVAVRFEAPQVRHPCDVHWRLRVVRGQEAQPLGAPSLRVYPAWDPEPLRKLLSDPAVAIADPSGSLLKLLGDLGLTARAVSTAVALRAFDGRVIVLAPGAAQAPDLIATALQAAAGGCTVVWLEPGDTTPWRDTFGLPRSTPSQPALRLPLAQQHPALLSLTATDLSMWREEGKGFSLAEPADGNYRGLVEATGDNSGFRMVELLPGSGRIVLCALPVASCFRAEPVARMLFESLMRYAATETPRFQPALLWAPPDSRLRTLAEKAGVALSDAWDANVALRSPDESRRSPSRPLVVAADAAAAQYALAREPQFAEKIRARLEAGAKCLFIGAEPQSAAFLERCGLRGVAFTSAPQDSDLRPQGVPLAWGISAAQFDAAARAGGEGERLFRYTALPGKGAEPAVTPGAIVKLRVGAGEAILCQLALDRAPEDPAALSVFRQLMTNLGVRLQAKDEQ